jgi:hypothetical protein
MAFNLRMGVPEMEAVWTDLSERKLQGQLDKNEEKFFKKLVKVLAFLQENPRHHSLQTHEIVALTRKYGFKVYEAYLENNIPGAGRVFWAYGPEKGDITILGVEPHPGDQRRAYARLKLSALPATKPRKPSQ